MKRSTKKNWVRSNRSNMPRTTMMNLRKTGLRISQVFKSIKKYIKEQVFSNSAGRRIPSRKARKTI
jgi:hypothetical protein